MFLKVKSMMIMALVASAVLYGCGENNKVDSEQLTAAIEARDASDKARDKYRNPLETLAFFRVEPGMTVAEALPGGGWYTKILVPYLGKNGAIYGVNYADDMWARFGFFSPDAIQQQIARTQKFVEMAKGLGDQTTNAQGFTFASMPDKFKGTADRVLFVRALHNLNRFEVDAGTMSQALKTTYDLLKDDGMVGVVQHRIPESADERGASGNRGYLKESLVIDLFNKAGFELVEKSEINANPNDQPGNEQVVWRLPPTLSGSADDPERRKKMQAIGESDRMTMLFKKVSK